MRFIKRARQHGGIKEVKVKGREWIEMFGNWENLQRFRYMNDKKRKKLLFAYDYEELWKFMSPVYIVGDVVEAIAGIVAKEWLKENRDVLKQRVKSHKFKNVLDEATKELIIQQVLKCR